DVLLELRDEERSIANQYRANEKRRVLQKLALHNQDNAQAQEQDRRSINYETVLAEIHKVLPSLSLNPNQDTKAILQEIVERSGLFIKIDSGDKYQFAHLSIQEFFTAEALRDDGDELIARYRKDTNAWRETVKLWCGLAKDSTELIKAIYAEDALLAFECLADAQDIEPDLASAIIDKFKNQLGRSGNEDNLAKAFGAVAASSRPRGKAVFEFLREILTLEAEPINRRRTAAIALSLTNLPQAAKVLAHQYASDDDEVRQALVKMGDIAVSELESKANENRLEPLNDLLAIATPNAENALIRFLWHSDKESASLAAWNLAALLPKPDIENRIHDFPLTPEHRQADYIDWIWQPFPIPQNSALPIIAGRIAYLLKIIPRGVIPTLEQDLDPRIIIPLCAIELKEKFQNQWNQDWDNLSAQNESLIGLERKINKLLNKSNLNYRWKLLFSRLSPQLQLDLFRRLNSYHSPTIFDWRNLFHKKFKYAFESSWHYKSVLLTSLAISLLAIIEMVLITTRQSNNWTNGLLSLGLLVISVSWIFFFRGIDIEKNLTPITFRNFYLFGFLNYWSKLRRWLTEEIVDNICLSVAESVAIFLSLLGYCWAFFYTLIVVSLIVTGNLGASILVAFIAVVVAAGAFALSKYKARTHILIWIFIITVNTFSVFIMIQNGALALTSLVFWALPVIGFCAWAKTEDEKDSIRLFAIFAYPFFCWSPIVFGFSTLALLEFLSWQYTVLVWVTVLGAGSTIWMQGQKLEAQARNPLKGILQQPKKLS
ncbi:MAG: HEAT repeat domain-containing protein, partial [Cyanobacteria bacterium J06621_12]